MTRKLKLLFIPLFIVVTIGSAVFASDAQRTPAWQNTLRGYAKENNLTIIQVVRARQPQHFTSELDYPLVYAGRFEYTADITYAQTDGYALALPYPPRQVQCVLVEHRGQRSLLFVNYYSDGLWQNDWVIHQGRNSSAADAAQALGKVGCDLP